MTEISEVLRGVTSDEGGKGANTSDDRFSGEPKLQFKDRKSKGLCDSRFRYHENAFCAQNNIFRRFYQQMLQNASL